MVLTVYQILIAVRATEKSILEDGRMTKDM